VCELRGNAVSSTNVFGADGLISRIVGNNRVCYLYDPLGNVVQRLDSGCNVLSTDAYDAYGNLVFGGDGSDPYGYKGQYGYYTDHETGLILCTHRYYDPTVGRWLTRDKLGYEGGIDLYEYCGGGIRWEGWIQAGIISLHYRDRLCISK
jgi:RHS repeat-associated protein